MLCCQSWENDLLHALEFQIRTVCDGFSQSHAPTSTLLHTYVPTYVHTTVVQSLWLHNNSNNGGVGGRGCVWR